MKERQNADDSGVGILRFYMSENVDELASRHFLYIQENHNPRRPQGVGIIFILKERHFADA